MSSIARFPNFWEDGPAPSQAFKPWFHRFTAYMDLNHRDESWTDKRRNQLLLLMLGSNGASVFQSHEAFEKIATMSWVDFAQAVTDTFKVETNPVRAHFDIFHHRQRNDETAAEFSASLKLMAAETKFCGDCKNILQATMLVVGTKDKTLQESLLREKNLEHDLILEAMKAAEAATSTKCHISSAPAAVHKVKQGNPHRGGWSGRARYNPQAQRPTEWNRKSSFTGQSNGSTGRRCDNCGNSDSHRECPARNSRCRSCQRIGHWGKVCKSSRRATEAKKIHHDEGQEDELLYNVGRVRYKLKQIGTRKPIERDSFDCEVRITAGGNSITKIMEVDSGADITLIPAKIYGDNFQNVELVPMKKTCSITGYGGSGIADVYGHFKAIVSVGNRKAELKMFIVPNTYSSLLGKDAIRALELQMNPKTFEVKTVATPSILDVTELLEPYPNLLATEVGEFPNFQHRITLREEAIPSVTKLRTIPLARRVGTETAIRDMEEMGIWEKCDYSDGQHAIVAVPKSDGTVRVTTDLTKLNQYVIPVRYPLPRMKDVIADVSGATIISKIDLAKAYFNINLAPESRRLTATITHTGLYAYKKLPMGLKDSSAVFQKCVSQALSGMTGCVAYMDDILVFGKSVEQHDLNLRRVLGALNDHNFRINPKKCQFQSREISFLGFLFISDGKNTKVKPNPERVRPLRNAPAPTDMKGVQRFMGMINYYHSFLPRLAQMAAPLRQLLRKGTKFEWTEDCQRSFDAIKEMLASTIIENSIFSPTAATIVSVDASGIGLAGYLTQLQGGKEVPIAFASHTLQDHERRYAANELEAMACLWACEHWENFLLGRHFTLRTDHKALEALLQRFGTGRKASKFARWHDRLSRFDYTVEYIKGRENIVADLLSRAPVSSKPMEIPISIRKIDHKLRVTGISWSVIQAATKTDAILSIQVLEHLLDGEWPSKQRIPPEQLPYFNVRRDMYATHGIMIRADDRIVLPEALQREVLVRAHQGHPGIVRMKRLLRRLYWWPGISAAAERFVKSCGQCQQSDKSCPPDAVTSSPLPKPTNPWTLIAIDVVGPIHTAPHSERFIITLMDHYSSYPFYKCTGDTSSSRVVQWLQTLFSQFGYPDQLLSDNGPQFISQEFEGYLEAHGIRHLLTPVYNPQTNGKLEVFHRYLKGGLQSFEEGGRWDEKLLTIFESYRLLPGPEGKSPAEKFLGWRPRQSFQPAGPLKEFRGNMPKRPLQPVGDLELRGNQPNRPEDICTRSRGPYRSGDKVFVRRPPAHILKGQPSWSQKPLTVQEALGDWTYRLSDGKVWNARKMRRVLGDPYLEAIPLPASRVQRYPRRQRTHTQRFPAMEHRLRRAPANRDLRTISDAE